MQNGYDKLNEFDKHAVDYLERILGIEGRDCYHLADIANPNNKIIAVTFSLGNDLHLGYDTTNAYDTGFTLHKYLGEIKGKNGAFSFKWATILWYRHGRADDKIWIDDLSLFLTNKELCIKLIEIAQTIEDIS